MDTEPPELSSADWQRLAARRAFQQDLPGAIQAMEQAVGRDPNNFHHRMWLGKLYRQAGNEAASIVCAREALRCLDEAPDRTVSPEERTRLIVRTSLLAGELGRAREAVSRLEALRGTALDACASADSASVWYQSDLFAAAIFETLVEIYRLIGNREAIDSMIGRYAASLALGLRLAAEDDASPEDLKVLADRIHNLENQHEPILVQ